MEMGERIKNARIAANITQAELAKKAWSRLSKYRAVGIRKKEPET